MEKRSALRFMLRIKASLFHSFVQAVADRAYTRGYDDAQRGEAKHVEHVRIDPAQVRKLHP